MSRLRAAMTLVPRNRPDHLPDAVESLSASIDRPALAAFQRVCGYPVSDRLPMTYPHILGFPTALSLMSRSDFPFPVVGLVHVANRVRSGRALTADDRLDLTVTASHLREHPRGRQFDLVTTVFVDGAEVWREHSTYLRRDRGQPTGVPPRTAGGDPTAGGTGGGRPDAERPAAPRPHAIWRVDPSVGRDYATVSGDHNPMHTSVVGARVLGFPRPIAHGMWSLARCLSTFEHRFDAATVDVAFKLPILLPATVGFTAGARAFALHDVRTGRPHLAGTITPG